MQRCKEGVAYSLDPAVGRDMVGRQNSGVLEEGIACGGRWPRHRIHPSSRQKEGCCESAGGGGLERERGRDED